MNIARFLRNPHVQFIISIAFGFLALILIHDFITRNVEFSIRWGIIIGATLLIVVVITAYTYLIVGKYDKEQWDRKFTWSIAAIKTLSLIALIAMVIATYLASMASGYQLGGILVPWMEILIVMLTILPIPTASYWAMVNLQQTFNKRYAWIALYIFLVPLAVTVCLAYSGNWLQDFYPWLKTYLGMP